MKMAKNFSGKFFLPRTVYVDPYTLKSTEQVFCTSVKCFHCVGRWLPATYYLYIPTAVASYV